MPCGSVRLVRAGGQSHARRHSQVSLRGNLPQDLIDRSARGVRAGFAQFEIRGTEYIRLRDCRGAAGRALARQSSSFGGFASAAFGAFHPHRVVLAQLLVIGLARLPRCARAAGRARPRRGLRQGSACARVHAPSVRRGASRIPSAPGHASRRPAGIRWRSRTPCRNCRSTSNLRADSSVAGSMVESPPPSCLPEGAAAHQRHRPRAGRRAVTDPGTPGGTRIAARWRTGPDGHRARPAFPDRRHSGSHPFDDELDLLPDSASHDRIIPIEAHRDAFAIKNLFAHPVVDQRLEFLFSWRPLPGALELHLKAEDLSARHEDFVRRAEQAALEPSVHKE